MQVDKNTIAQISKDYFAVIDIGSNTVRLVVYSDVVRVPDIIFNEKAFCGLGKDVGRTGLMDDVSMTKAIQTLKRFKALCDQMQVKHIHAVATAAVRDARNGAEFIQSIQKQAGISVQVIAGTQEARLAALGVVSGTQNVSGVVADLGGGSLELARVEDGEVLECSSLPIGSLRLKNEAMGGKKEWEQVASQAISGVSWLKDASKNLYIVGGSWRNVAKLIMREQKEPISILHNYAAHADDIAAFAKALAAMKPDDIKAKTYLSTKRRDILPVAALVLAILIEKMGAEAVIVSSNGVREGVVFDSLEAQERAKDPFILAAQNLANERCRFPEHGALLYGWTRALYPNLKESHPKTDRLHYAACVLSDIAWRGHPDFRAERAVEIMLHGRWLGVNHAERAYIAVVLNAVYGEKRDAKHIKKARLVLSDEEENGARSLGFAIRLAQRLSGGAVTALDVSHLTMSDSVITLWIDKKYPDLRGEIVTRRLAALAKYFDRDIAIKLSE